MKILIIEDEPAMLEVIRQSLEKEKYVVETAADYRLALNKLISFDYDCILLDITLPGGSGLKILQEIKSSGIQSSVIIISAKDSLDDKITGLDLGADDYLTKPFHMAELHARIKSVLRRKVFEGQQVNVIGNLSLHFENRIVVVNEQTLPLNRKEFDILNYLMVNKNRLVAKASLAEHVWGDHTDEADDFEFIYSQIKNLRKKLKDFQASVEIQAVYGIGYKLTEL